MASQIPSGHPGDVMWRLPLARTLASMGAVANEQVQAANKAAARGGLFVTHLLETGANADKVLTAWAVATGLPSAPRYETRNPPRELASRAEGSVWRALLAVPFATDGEWLCVAYAVPLPADKLVGLPRHKAFVALEPEVLHGLDHLFPAVRRLPSAQPGTAPAVSVPPAPAAPAAPVAIAMPDLSAAPPMPSLDFSPLPSTDGAGTPAYAAPPADAFSLQDQPPPAVPAPAPEAQAGPPMPSLDFGAAPPAAAPLQFAPLPPTNPDGQAPTQPAAPRVVAPAQAPVPNPDGAGALVTYDSDDRYAELKGQLTRLKLPIAIVVGLLLMVKVVSCVVDRSRSEVESKGSALAEGIHSSTQEAVKNKVAEVRAEGQPSMVPPHLAPPPPRSEETRKAATGTFDSANAALAEAEFAARKNEPDFIPKCHALVAELRAYRARTPLPARELVQLHNVTSEVMGSCEQENGQAGFPALRDRVSRALRGEAP